MIELAGVMAKQLRYSGSCCEQDMQWQRQMVLHRVKCHTSSLGISATHPILFSYAAQMKSIQGRDAHLFGLIRAELFLSNLVVRNINPVFPKSESASVAVLFPLESFQTNNSNPSEWWSTRALMEVFDFCMRDYGSLSNQIMILGSNIMLDIWSIIFNELIRLAIKWL